jgi:neuroplastin
LNFILKGKESENETSAHYHESNDRVTLSVHDDIANAKLTIENAQLSDRGFYGCIGKSEIMNDEDVKSEGHVRVKDKYAALWPFVGICAEVFVLCAIILFYEKSRNKDSDNDSDTDQGE